MIIPCGKRHFIVEAKQVRTDDGVGWRTESRGGEVYLELEIDVEALVHQLGPKAALSKRKRSHIGHGAVVMRARLP